jgi:hypothetical protein
LDFDEGQARLDLTIQGSRKLPKGERAKWPEWAILPHLAGKFTPVIPSLYPGFLTNTLRWPFEHQDSLSISRTKQKTVSIRCDSSLYQSTASCIGHHPSSYSFNSNHHFYSPQNGLYWSSHSCCSGPPGCSACQCWSLHKELTSHSG